MIEKISETKSCLFKTDKQTNKNKMDKPLASFPGGSVVKNMPSLNLVWSRCRPILRVKSFFVQIPIRSYDKLRHNGLVT